MANEVNWDALGTIGTWTGMGVAGIWSIVRWIRGQKKSILKEVADLRESHENQVERMRVAHAENEERLIKLEAHEQSTAAKLREIGELMKAVNVKQDRQMEILLLISNQGRQL